MCCTPIAGNIGRKKSPFWHHRTNFSGYIFATARIDNRKNLLNSNISPIYVSTIWRTSAYSGWDLLASLGHPCKFWRVSRLGSVNARQSSSGRQPNFAGLNRGRHLYSAKRPSRRALAHIYSSILYTRYSRLSTCQTGNQFDNRLERTVCSLNTVVKPCSFNTVLKRGLTTGWTNSGCSFNTVVKQVDNWLYRVYEHSTGCQPVWRPVWQLVGCLFTRYSRLSNRYNPVWQPDGQPAVYTIQPFVKPVVKRVWQPVECLYTRYNRLSNRFDNRFDNRLYRVNGALWFFIIAE